MVIVEIKLSLSLTGFASKKSLVVGSIVGDVVGPLGAMLGLLVGASSKQNALPTSSVLSRQHKSAAQCWICSSSY